MATPTSPSTSNKLVQLILHAIEGLSLVISGVVLVAKGDASIGVPIITAGAAGLGFSITT